MGPEWSYFVNFRCILVPGGRRGPGLQISNLRLKTYHMVEI